MKRSSKTLTLILVLGLAYSFLSLFNRHGAGLGDSMDGITWTSIILCIASLTIIVRNRKDLENHIVTFIFLAISLPITILAGRTIIHYKLDDKADTNPNLMINHQPAFKITSYELRPFLKNSQTNLPAIIDSISYQSTILSDGKISTKRRDSTRYARVLSKYY